MAMHPTLNRENRVQVSGEVRAGRQPDDRLLSKAGAAPPIRTAAAPPSYGGRPGSAPGIGSMCSYSNWQRGRLEEADVAGSTPAERTSSASQADSAGSGPVVRSLWL
jgi:hypothetical protein